MTTTTRVMTEWGEMSIHKRDRYYYAVKTINGTKRQVYLGKSIPCQGRLEEVAEEINVKGDTWHQLHKPKQKQHTNPDVSVAVERLRKVRELAKVRGENVIADQLDQVIKLLFS